MAKGQEMKAISIKKMERYTELTEGAKERLKKKQEEINKRIKAKKIIDNLLEKIAREGMSALTPKEKKDLEWARRHYYPNEGDILH